MCAAIVFGLFLIVGGASVTTQGDVAIGIITISMGVMWLSMFLDVGSGKSYRIDSSVRNKVVAHDGNGRYLVKADTSRQITGPRPHVTGNMPASLIEIQKGLWVVDSNGYCNDYSRVNWQPVDGDYHIEPRGNTETGGFLRDVMEGYEHYYVVRDDQ